MALLVRPVAGAVLAGDGDGYARCRTRRSLPHAAAAVDARAGSGGVHSGRMRGSHPLTARPPRASERQHVAACASPRSTTRLPALSLARVLRPGGELALSVAEGDGEFWEQVSYQPGHQRWYVLHRIGPMTARLTVAGFEVTSVSRRSTHRDWLQLRARLH